MTIVQTQVKGVGRNKIVKTVRIDRKPDHIAELAMVEDEALWISTPAGEIRISTINAHGKTTIEVYRGTAETVKFERV